MHSLTQTINLWIAARNSYLMVCEEEFPLKSLEKLAVESFETYKNRKYIGSIASAKGAKCRMNATLVSGASELVFPYPHFSPEFVNSNNYMSIYSNPDLGIISLFADSDEVKLFSSAVSFLKNRDIANTFVIRAGFFTTLYDVWESIVLGFDSVLIYARDISVPYLQLLTETCREYRVSLVAVVDSIKVLDKVLETDIPYFCIPAFSDEGKKNNLPLIINIAQRIPSTCTKIAWLADTNIHDEALLAKLNIKISIV